MRSALARLTSNVFNPFLVSFVVIILLAFESTVTAAEAFRWLSISLALSVLPVFAFVFFMVRINKLDGIFINSRRQRTKVYALATFLAIIGVAVLHFLGAPKLMLATFVAGLAALAVYMSINLYWKISLHTGFIAAAAAILIIVYGIIAVWVVMLAALVAWARIEMKLHSTIQVVSGALLSVVIVIIVFQLFGMIGD